MKDYMKGPNTPLDADKGISNGMGGPAPAMPVDASANMGGLQSLAMAEAMSHQGKYDDAYAGVKPK